MLNKKSVDDINVKGKKVLVRCDFNVPLIDGKITDENRLVAALPTIKKLIADGGKVILCSHLGKPKGEPKPELSLAPVAVRLSELLGQEVKLDVYKRQQYTQVKIINEDYLWYLLRWRVMPLALAVCVANLGFRRLTAAGILLWTGFAAGILLSLIHISCPKEKCKWK